MNLRTFITTAAMAAVAAAALCTTGAACAQPAATTAAAAKLPADPWPRDISVPSAAVHEMSMSGGVMRMRPIPKLDVGPDKAASLAPGGYHLMLEGLKKPLRKGESVPLSLVFEGKDGKRFTLEAKAKVIGLSEAAPPAMAPIPRR